jgi:hypothetical protein
MITPNYNRKVRTAGLPGNRRGRPAAIKKNQTALSKTMHGSRNFQDSGLNDSQ